MSATEYEVHVALEARARLGEGPLWDDETQTLFWVDIYNHRVHRYFPDLGRDQVFDVGDVVGCVAVSGPEALLVALRRELARLDLGTGEVKSILKLEDEGPNNRLNDGKCDPQGRFWFASMSRVSGAAHLYRYDPDGSLRVMESGLTIGNGLGWSPDSRTFYLTDSPEKTIYAYDYDKAAGTIGNRRVFVDLEEEPSFPDGLAIDADGHVWSAQWDGGSVIRFAPEGAEVERIRLPVRRPTSCAFGGADRTQLYITSASVGLDEEAIEQNFHSGDLFCVETRSVGLPSSRFGG